MRRGVTMRISMPRRDTVFCTLASAGKCANAVHHRRDGQISVLLVVRCLGRRRDRPEPTVVLVVGAGGENSVSELDLAPPPRVRAHSPSMVSGFSSRSLS